VIDIHCHLLPEVDDGPRTWDVSQEMCRMAAADGIEHIVTTPHANERYHYDREYLARLVTHLQELVGPLPRITLGCDFHLSYENMQDALVNPANYTIEGTNYLLVEFSNYSIPAQIDNFFGMLGSSGITPIITHPERNPLLQKNPEKVLQWIELGCAVQVTAGVVTGAWGDRAWRAAKWLFEREAVHILASDAHDTQHRVPNLSKARDASRDEFCDSGIAKMLVDDNPRAIISGKPLPYFPNPVLGR
jgi:protein-tyrosine phosphatase